VKTIYLQKDNFEEMLVCAGGVKHGVNMGCNTAEIIGSNNPLDQKP
jgi:hypothetical protein